MSAIMPYRIGQQVQGIVEKVYPYGLFMQLSDGASAYVRRRELSWDRDLDPLVEFTCGQKLSGEVIALATGNQVLELSRLPTLPDPRDEFIRSHREGDVVQGRVADVVDNGIIVEIVPGVYGFVHRHEYANWEPSRFDDLYWVNDIVEARIVYIHPVTRKIGLSIRQHLDHQKRTMDLAQSVTTYLGLLQPKPTIDEQKSGIYSDELEESRDLDPDKFRRLGRVLIIEDHDEISNPLTAWLARRGCQAEAVSSAEDAYAKVRQTRYDWIIIDIDLPGMSGLGFARHHRSEFGGARLIVTSVAEQLRTFAEEILALGVAAVFVKPLNSHEVDEVLTGLARGDHTAASHLGLIGDQPRKSDLTPFDALPQAFTQKATVPERIHHVLLWLQERTDAERVIVFAKDGVSHAIGIVASLGLNTYSVTRLNELDDSPVEDLMRDGRIIWEGAVSIHARARFRKLLEFVVFESCIGILLPIEHESTYSLFLFHSRINTFVQQHVRDAQVAALLLSAALERECFDEHVQSMDTLLLSGQLAVGFGHEVFNKMSGLEIQVENLRADLQIACSEARRPHADDQMAELRQAATELARITASLRATVDLFRQSLTVSNAPTSELGEALRQAKAILRPTAQQLSCRIELEIPDTFPVSVHSGVKLQQAFINIMLNAIQQMALAEAGLERVLTVVVSPQEDHENRPIQIRFRDNGPGIHRHLWEKIFRLGVSSRSDGTGIGLYVTRSFIESAGGQVFVERSIIPMGTTMLVELPVLVSQGKE